MTIDEATILSILGDRPSLFFNENEICVAVYGVPMTYRLWTILMIDNLYKRYWNFIPDYTWESIYKETEALHSLVKLPSDYTNYTSDTCDMKHGGRTDHPKREDTKTHKNHAYIAASRAVKKLFVRLKAKNDKSLHIKRTIIEIEEEYKRMIEDQSS